MVLYISSRCVFAPWLHWRSFISVWMVSRQASYSAPTPRPPLILEKAKKRLQWKLHLCLPCNRIGPSLKWGQMTHEPRVHFSHSPFRFLLTHLEGRKEHWHCDVKRVEKPFCLLSKNSRVRAACESRDKYSLLHSSHAQVKQEKKVVVAVVHIV